MTISEIHKSWNAFTPARSVQPVQFLYRQDSFAELAGGLADLLLRLRRTGLSRRSNAKGTPMTFYPHCPPSVCRKCTETPRRVIVGLAVLTTTGLTLTTGALFANSAHAAPTLTSSSRDDAAPIHRVARVNYRDLDLAQPEHVAMLKKRLKAAARRLCAPTPGMLASGVSFPPGCVLEAVADGNRQIDRAVVVAIKARQNTELADDADAFGATARPL